MSQKEKNNVREIIVEKKIGFNYLEVIIIMIISILFGFIIGNVANFVKGKTISSSVPKDLEELVTTYDDILDNYYEKVNKEDLIDAAIAGMINYLDDPYSSYLDQTQSESFNQTVDGEYVGLGTTISYKAGVITFVNTVKKGPSDKAGLKDGDILKAINGQDITDLDLNEVVQRMKGKKGETIELKVQRQDEEKVLKIVLDTIEITSVTSKIYEQENKKIGYLKIDIFAANTAKQFKAELQKLEKNKIDSLILDVRDNPGGHLTQVSEILSLFLTKKQVMYQIEEKGKKKKIYGLSNEKRTYPIAVLANESSASAAEILTSCMKEVYGASIIGITTYGKGTVQKSMTLRSGSTIKYTTEKWYTAKGNWINEVGVEPMIEVAQSEEYLTTGLETCDTQLEKAKEVLSQK